MLLVGLPSWYFFGLLVRPDTDLGQDVLDMTYVFCVYCIVYFLITNSLFHLTYFYVTFYLDIIMCLVLFIIIFVVTFNFLLLLCISTLQLLVQVILFAV